MKEKRMPGSACWKCMRCVRFRQGVCRGMLEYWGPYCAREFYKRPKAQGAKKTGGENHATG